MQVGDGAATADDVDVGAGEVGAAFTQDEGERGSLTGDDAGFINADLDGGLDGIRCWVDGGVVADGDLVAVGGTQLGGGTSRCRAQVGIKVGITGIVGKFAAGDADGATAGATGCWGKDGGVFGVASGSSAAGGYRGEVAERTAGDGDVAHVEVGAGFIEGEGDGFGAAGGECGAGVGALDKDGRRRGVARWHRADARVDAIVLNGVCLGATGASDGTVNGGISVGSEVAGRHVDAVVTGAVEHVAGKVLAIDGEGDLVTNGEFAGDMAGDGDVAGVFTGANDVVSGDGVDGQRSLRRIGRTGGVDNVILRGGSEAAAGAGNRPFDLGVGVVEQICGGDIVDAVAAVRIYVGGVFLAVERKRDFVASDKGASDFTGDGGGALPCFGAVDDVVAGYRIDGECSFQAGRWCGAWNRIKRDVSIDAIILQRSSGSATGAVDGAVNGGVWIVDEFVSRHTNAVGAVGSRRGGVGVAVDLEGNDIARGVFAGDLTGNGDVAGGFGYADDVVWRDFVDHQRGLGVDVARLNHVVLRGGGIRATGASDAAFDLGVGVRCKFAGGDGFAEAAVGGNRHSVRLAVEREGDGVTRSEHAGDFTGDGDKAGVFRSEDDVVTSDGVNGDGSLGARRGQWRRVGNVDAIVL